jgi:hypothetical protein
LATGALLHIAILLRTKLQRTKEKLKEMYFHEEKVVEPFAGGVPADAFGLRRQCIVRQ